MTRPVINLDEIVEFDDIEENGIYTSKRALFSARIGAWQLGYNLTVLPPGKVQCPFHSHPLTNQAPDELHVGHPQTGDGRKWHIALLVSRQLSVSCGHGARTSKAARSLGDRTPLKAKTLR
jgi:hypothetical protein